MIPKVKLHLMEDYADHKIKLLLLVGQRRFNVLQARTPYDHFGFLHDLRVGALNDC